MKDKLKLLGSLVLSLLLGGCLSQTQQTPETYLLAANKVVISPQGVRPFAAQSIVNNKLTLQLQPVQILTQFGSQSFVYRFSERAYSQDFYHRFFIPPAQQIEQLLLASLANLPIYKAVITEAGVLPDAILAVTVTNLYVDMRKGRPAAVVLSLQCQYYYQEQFTRRLVMAKVIDEWEPLDKGFSLPTATLMAYETGLRKAFQTLGASLLEVNLTKPRIVNPVAVQPNVAPILPGAQPIIHTLRE
jgi:uncharacterized lipoprotein YmbA